MVVPLNLLRGINAILGWLYSILIGNFHFYNRDENTFTFQIICTLLPINFFYNFLYYTDTLSTLLITYYYYLNFTESSKKNIFIVHF